MTVVSLAEERIARTPHVSGEALCIGCRHQWVSVAPVGTWQLECPKCGAMKGIFKFPIGTTTPGDDIFTCDCGCEALTAYVKKGHFWLRCMSCGVDHTNSVWNSP